jgi:HAD superfamily hydrolase (TIGR01509 family)
MSAGTTSESGDNDLAETEHRWRPDGVVFDCDGLLLDTESRWTISERGVVQAWGGVMRPDLKQRLLGRALPDAAKVIAEEVGASADAIPDIAVALDEGFSAALAVHGCVAMPGAVELAGALRRAGIPIALASNTRRAHVELALAAAGLADVFEVIVSAGDACGGRPLPPKPAPDIYLRACALLQVDPADAIALEDSPTGVQAGRQAGLRVIGVPSLEEHVLEADAVIPSLAALSLDEATLELSCKRL